MQKGSGFWAKLWPVTVWEVRIEVQRVGVLA